MRNLFGDIFGTYSEWNCFRKIISLWWIALMTYVMLVLMFFSIQSNSRGGGVICEYAVKELAMCCISTFSHGSEWAKRTVPSRHLFKLEASQDLPQHPVSLDHTAMWFFKFCVVRMSGGSNMTVSEQSHLWTWKSPTPFLPLWPS